jgi:LysM repeat protein
MNKLGTNKHIVTKGENLSIIARKNNTTSANLKQLNKFSGKKLNPGQVLIIK